MAAADPQNPTFAGFHFSRKGGVHANLLFLLYQFKTDKKQREPRQMVQSSGTRPQQNANAGNDDRNVMMKAHFLEQETNDQKLACYSAATALSLRLHGY